ncbi:hypothetical protein TNCV_2064561 [Trichonephila clavipes]|nr:hypothetical protein TNCV_2064561 [Trichonephila clavipes]
MNSKKGITRWRQKIGDVIGMDTVTARTCQRWFVKFCSRAFSLKDEPRSGRLSDVNDEVLNSIVFVNICVDCKTG